MALHPELEEDAQTILTEAGVPWSDVVHVDHDCILYVNGHKARTLWLSRQPGTGRLRTLMAEGFQAEAPAAWGLD
jgi:hypothetical protein